MPTYDVRGHSAVDGGTDESVRVNADNPREAVAIARRRLQRGRFRGDKFAIVSVKPVRPKRWGRAYPAKDYTNA